LGASPTLARRILGSLIALLVFGMVSSVGGTTAEASYYTCDTPAANHQAGFSTNNWVGSTQPYLYEGVSATMSIEFGNLCSTDTNGGVNFSTAWNMVFGSSGGYVQSGTMLRASTSTCWQFWSEQDPGNGTFTDWYLGCAAQHSTHKVWQQTVLINDAWRLRSNIDSTIVHQSNFSPFSNWNAPFHVAFSGETYHTSSDVPGYAAAPTAHSNMQVQLLSNNTWVGTCGNVYLGRYLSPRYSADAPACDYVRVWTSG